MLSTDRVVWSANSNSAVTPNGNGLASITSARPSSDAFRWLIRGRKSKNPSLPPSGAGSPSKTLDFVDSKLPLFGDRPPFKCLADWWWGGDPDNGDHSLYDKDGLTIARLVLEGGQYRLRSPIVRPRQSWPELELAKRGAEWSALAALPLDPKFAARIKRENETPHPMGPPLNTSWPLAEGSARDWKPSPTATGCPDIPRFLDLTLCPDCREAA